MMKYVASRSLSSYRRPGLWLSALALALASQACYHATGVQRSAPAVEEITSGLGDRVAGVKAAAGPGDYFLGNDAVALAVDGVPYGSPGVTIAGALSGGSAVTSALLGSVSIPLLDGGAARAQVRVQSAALEQAHLLVFRPRDASPQALQELLNAGWSATDIVILSQLVAFLSFQIRVVVGLRALAAHPALPQTTEVQP